MERLRRAMDLGRARLRPEAVRPSSAAQLAAGGWQSPAGSLMRGESGCAAQPKFRQ